MKPKTSDTSSYPYPTSPTLKTLQILNVLGYLLMVFVNFLANWLPINGNTTGELSDKYDNLFVPTGATFSIWGIIYLLLLVYTIYQASTLFSTKSRRVNLVVHQVSIWYLASSVMNALWIIAWHYELLPISVAIMWILLLSLILVNFGLINSTEPLSRWELILAKASFGIYLGWISVATIANMTTWLIGIKWVSGLEEDTWAVLMILIGAIIAMYAASKLGNGYLALAVVWAFTGIYLKRINEVPLYYSIAYVAGACAVVLFIHAAVLILKDFTRKSDTTLNASEVGA